jgi:hypothetical protein
MLNVDAHQQSPLSMKRFNYDPKKKKIAHMLAREAH